MKIRTLFIVFLGLAALGGEALHAQGNSSGEKTCSPETLKGTYTYHIQGYRDGKPYASGGFLSFDGKGQVLNLYTNSVIRDQDLATGTYTVDGRCTGSMTLNETTVNQFYVSPNGEDFVFVRITGDGIVGTQARRVTRELLVTGQ